MELCDASSRRPPTRFADAVTSEKDSDPENAAETSSSSANNKAASKVSSRRGGSPVSALPPSNYVPPPQKSKPMRAPPASVSAISKHLEAPSPSSSQQSSIVAVAPAPRAAPEDPTTRPLLESSSAALRRIQADRDTDFFIKRTRKGPGPPPSDSSGDDADDKGDNAVAVGAIASSTFVSRGKDDQADDQDGDNDAPGSNSLAAPENPDWPSEEDVLIDLTREGSTSPVAEISPVRQAAGSSTSPLKQQFLVPGRLNVPGSAFASVPPLGAVALPSPSKATTKKFNASIPGAGASKKGKRHEPADPKPKPKVLSRLQGIGQGQQDQADCCSQNFQQG
ncbi:hypothetical protein V8E36_006720 [Tilletia maclaganii]